MAVQSSSNLARKVEPKSIGSSAAENLRYIRSTIEAAHTFTTVPGKGCVAMGITALTAFLLESVPTFASHWLAIWLMTAFVSGMMGFLFMEAKARSQRLSLLRSVARRFFLTLAPAFLAGALLTLALVDSVARNVTAAIWLLLYGVGISACGVFSAPVVLVSGFAFMGLGAISLAAPPAWAPMLLAAGFGGIHLILGTIIWREHGG